MKWAWAAGISAAKSATKWSCSIHQFPLLSGLNALEACGTAVSIDAQLSPSSSAKAAMYTSAATFVSVAGLGDDGSAVTVANQNHRPAHGVDCGLCVFLVVGV